MAQNGKLTFEIQFNFEPILKAFRKFEGDVFASQFDGDAELQSIKNLNNICDSEEKEY